MGRRGQHRLGRWCLRLAALSALVATLVCAGPRALAVTRARAASFSRSVAPGPHVELDRVGFVDAPDWLRGDLLTMVALDLAPALAGRIGLTDQAAAVQLLGDLRAVPWVRDASLQRVYPDRLRAVLALRRPVARLTVGEHTVALDRDGICLPCPPRSELPELDVAQPRPGVPGQVHPDVAVRAAAAVAAEWVDEIAPNVAAAPSLRRVDAANLGYQLDPARMSEVRVALARAGGGLVWLDYDHPPGSDAPRVPPPTKIAVLQNLLAAHPGFAGVARADLRFKNRWQAWVEPEGLRAPPP